MPEELDAHPAPEVEEDIDGDGDRQQQAVETQTVAAGAALREVLIHSSREEQTKQRHNGNQSNHQGQGEHPGSSTITHHRIQIKSVQFKDVFWLEFRTKKMFYSAGVLGGCASFCSSLASCGIMLGMPSMIG